MLNNDQCIEVAKLWGWEWVPDEDGKETPGYWWVEDEMKSSSRVCYEEINSWQGFGRTVEAMADKYKNNTYQYNLRVRISCLILQYVTGEISMDTLWSEVHLAALEAVREEENA